MKLDTKKIDTEGLSLTFEAPAGDFPVLKEMVDDQECFFSTPLTIEVHAAPEADLIKIKGTVAVDVQLTCSRCLEPYPERLNRRFTLRFSHEIPSELAAAGAEEVELTAEQINLMHFDGETVDLKEAIQEQVVLALPFKPLCRETCKGLCARCGADLNAGPCGCKSNGRENPFAVLKNKQWPSRQ